MADSRFPPSEAAIAASCQRALDIAAAERHRFFGTEPTDQGLQYVIPGCEHDRTRGPEQMDIFK